VKFLVDNNLSPLLAQGLNANGHDAIHLRDVGLQAATDEVVLARAALDGPGADLSRHRLRRIARSC
jgi:predicted nuclease of predicted toxin-antitoxin system